MNTFETLVYENIRDCVDTLSGKGTVTTEFTEGGTTFFLDTEYDYTIDGYRDCSYDGTGEFIITDVDLSLSYGEITSFDDDGREVNVKKPKFNESEVTTQIYDYIINLS